MELGQYDEIESLYQNAIFPGWNPADQVKKIFEEYDKTHAFPHGELFSCN